MWGQCGLFLFLNILDAHSTWLVLKPDFYHRERNPIARWIFRKLHLPRGIIIFKLILLTLLGWFIWHWHRDSLTINIGVLIGNLLFIIVVLHNYRVAKRFHLQDSREQAFLIKLKAEQ